MAMLYRGRRIPRCGPRRVRLSLLLTLCVARVGLAQTPSPLREWQYPGGIILQHLFDPHLPRWRRIVGVAVDLEPVYSGSRAYHTQAGPVLNVRYRDVAFASLGEGIGVNLIHSRHVRAGLALGFDMGRAVSSDYAHLHGLGKLDFAASPKAFVSWAVAKGFPLILRADIRRPLRDGDGYVEDIEAYMPLPGSSRRFVMFAGPAYSFADRKHLQTQFGVTPLQAQQSGQRVFLSHAGSESEGVGFSATLFLTPHWLLNLDAAVDRLLGSARGSPITQRRTQRALDLASAFQW
jgi:outer membrane scaffolding protein for murein synthesis (MipA/OmpV family)